MGEQAVNAVRYRRHAKQLRGMADAERNEEQRQSLRKIADDYEALAETADLLDAANKPEEGKP